MTGVTNIDTLTDEQYESIYHRPRPEPVAVAQSKRRGVYSVTVGWRRRNEYTTWRPQIERGHRWTAVRWAWFRVAVER